MEIDERTSSIEPVRGNGDGMYAEETRRNTGSPSGDQGIDQLATRERQAGPYGVAEISAPDAVNLVSIRRIGHGHLPRNGQPVSRLPHRIRRTLLMLSSLG
jgi:hypothetical protein